MAPASHSSHLRVEHEGCLESDEGLRHTAARPVEGEGPLLLLLGRGRRVVELLLGRVLRRWPRAPEGVRQAAPARTGPAHAQRAPVLARRRRHAPHPVREGRERRRSPCACASGAPPLLGASPRLRRLSLLSVVGPAAPCQLVCEPFMLVLHKGVWEVLLLASLSELLSHQPQAGREAMGYGVGLSRGRLCRVPQQCDKTHKRAELYRGVE
eukprot:scaffold1987_cov377-Prasinococcus_capsulatus_cf.AAC.12